MNYLLDLPPNTSIIILCGGLGNKLFQYSLAAHLEQKYKKNLFLYDISSHYKISHSSEISKISKKKYKFLNPNKIPKLIKIFEILLFFTSSLSLSQKCISDTIE